MSGALCRKGRDANAAVVSAPQRRVAARAERARVAGAARSRAGSDGAVRLRDARRAGGEARRRVRGVRSRERRPRRARLAQRARVHRDAVRLLVGGPHRRAGQREAPRAGARVRDRRQRRTLDLRGPALAFAHRVRRPGLHRRRARRSPSAVPTTNASRPAILPRRLSHARRTIRHGCSTRAARPDGPRASRSRTATSTR